MRRCWSRPWWRATSSSGSSAASRTTGQFAEEDAELLGAVANQTAVGLKKAELIERLTAENLVKDMFDALAAGSVEAGRGQGERGGLRPDSGRTSSCTSSARPERPADGRLVGAGGPVAGRGCGGSDPRAFFDSRPDRVRALAPLPSANGRCGRGAPGRRASRWAARRDWSSD